ncbi:MAG: hypothetical protein CO189_01285 [candidate division Zixibacteria bacterium CG_4_9_14_3_um_filter_46_8]|nr:MAG: hypothetical protein CO189_01285 [candidate division Zixibacteria bacterium CG_4_9_14_3_um_filter_46_8]
MPDQVKLKIEDRDVTVDKGQTILDAALKLGIIVPTFCWDPRLKPIAACRMCLVEVEKAPKLVPSCAVPAIEGMVVKVFSEKAIRGRKAVLEFILSNHPLDCPTCDKGGECILQDHTFNHGPTGSRTIEPRNRTIFDEKYKFDDFPLGPVIWLNMNRCIFCFKCTRIIKEIAGDDDLGAFNRGYHTILHGHKNRPFRSEFSGNTVENCPVGALVANSFRYKVRSWLLKKTPSVCHLCGDGCNITLWHQGQKLFRIYSRWNRNVDNGLLCDRGRFGGLYADSDRRLRNPKIRREGKLIDTTWEEALDFVAGNLESIRAKFTAAGIGVIGNEMLSNEETYLLSRIARRVIGTNNIDFRFEDKFTPSTDLNLKLLYFLVKRIPFSKFGEFRNHLIIGTDTEVTHPIMTLWLKRAISSGRSKCYAAYHRKTDFTLHPVESIEYFPQGEYNFLLALYSALKGKSIDESALASGVASTLIQRWAELLKGSKTLLLAGEALYNNPRGSENIDLLKAICDLLGEGSVINIPYDGSNYLGNLLWGATPGILPGGSQNDEENRSIICKEWKCDNLPEAGGMDTSQMLTAASEGKMGALIFFGSDPVGFYPDREIATKAVQNASFKVACETFLTETGKLCDAVLPLAPFPECSGSLISSEGRLQFFEKAFDPAYSSAEGWRIILRLAQRLGFEGDYSSPSEIWSEMASIADKCGKVDYKQSQYGGQFLKMDFAARAFSNLDGFQSSPLPSPTAEFPMILTYGASVYQKRNLTAYAESMDKIDPGPKLYINPDNAAKMKLYEGDTVRVSSTKGSLTMKSAFDYRIRPGTVFIPTNFQEAEFNSLLSSKSDLTFVKIERL